MNRWISRVAANAAFFAFAAAAADLPPATQGDWIAPEFRFHTGEIMKDVRLHYVTFGDPGNDAVLVLHGTGGSSRSMTTPGFAGQLFGPHDEWYGRPGMNFHDRAGVLGMLAGMEVLQLVEDDHRGMSFEGPKHWHVFHVIARA